MQIMIKICCLRIGPVYALTFAAGDIQGKQHAVIAGIYPLPTHQIPSAMLLLKFAGNR